MKDWKDSLGKMVFSTHSNPNPDFEPEEGDQAIEPGNQRLRIWLDRKKRKGKAVTLIKDFEGPESAMEELGKELKKLCGVGGSVKDGEILLQGDQRKKVLNHLVQNGYTQSKIAGS